MMMLVLKSLSLIFILPYRWLKAHPMNGYLVQEILVLALASLGLIYLSMELGLFQAIDENNGYAIFWQISLIIGIVGGIAMVISDMCELDQRSFYSNWQFYGRYKTFGVIVKMLSKLLYGYIAFSLITVFFLNFLFGAVIYILALLLVGLFLLSITALAKYSLALIQNRQELGALLITMTITAISYFLYRDLFGNQLVIWIVALFTGGLSSLVVKLILSFSGQTIIQAYDFFNFEKAEIDEREGWKGNWMGIMIFMPFAWIFKQISKVGDKSLQGYRQLELLR